MSTTTKLSCDDLEERVVKISIERLLEAKFTLVCQTYVWVSEFLFGIAHLNDLHLKTVKRVIYVWKVHLILFSTVGYLDAYWSKDHIWWLFLSCE